jgi:hypothetical protein
VNKGKRTGQTPKEPGPFPLSILKPMGELRRDLLPRWGNHSKLHHQPQRIEVGVTTDDLAIPKLVYLAQPKLHRASPSWPRKV